MTELKTIPEDKKLTTWELASTLEACAKALKDMPLSIVRNVEYEEQEAYLRIESTIKGVNNRLVELEKALADTEETVVKAADEHYQRIQSVINRLNGRLRELPEIETGLHLPYNTEELFKTAERYSYLSDDQWAKLIELAKAFATKGN